MKGMALRQTAVEKMIGGGSGVFAESEVGLFSGASGVGDLEFGDKLLSQLSSELIDSDEGVGDFGTVRVCCLLEGGASRCRSIMVVGALADGEEFDFLRCAPLRCFTILERTVRDPAACTPQVHLPRDRGGK